MLHRLCGPPSIHLSFNLAAVLPRRLTQCVSCETQTFAQASSQHRLRRGLPGYLILFATHAFAYERQYLPRRLPSPLVFFQISTHSTATPGIPSPPAILQPKSLKCSSQVEPGPFTSYFLDRLHALYAQLFRLTLAPSVLPRLLARSQPVLLLRVTSFLLPSESALQPEGLLHTRGMAASGFPPLCNIPYCCLPQESGPCLSPNVADHPLRPARDRRLGEPLPHLLANPSWAHLIATFVFPPKGACGISSRFQLLSPTIRQIPRYYSPVRHSSAKEASFFSVTVRLACIRPAASVQSEP